MAPRHDEGVLRLAIISDIHLAAEPRVDEFGHTTDAFQRFLDALESTSDRIYLNGDIFEGLRGRQITPIARRGETLRAASRYRPLVQRLNGPKYRWTVGNHDTTTSEFGIPSSRCLEVDSSTILIVHGHHFDRLERWLPGLSPLVNWVNGWSTRIVGRDADDGLYRLEAWLLGIREDHKKDAFQRAAVQYARRAGAQLVVTGHTHTGGVFSHPECVYANSGTCSLGRFEWLSIDTAKRAVSFNRGWPECTQVQSCTWQLPSLGTD